MGNQNSIQHNISVREWSEIPSPSSFIPREGSCSAVIGNKMILFGGGYKSEKGPELLNQIIIFSFDTREWTELRGSLGDAPNPKTGACCCIVDQKLYVFGGQTNRGWTNEFHCLDLETNEWKVIPTSDQTPCGRDKMGCCVIGKKIYIFGGFGALSDSDMEELDQEEEEDEEIDVVGDSDEESQNRGPSANFSWFQDLTIFDTETNSWQLVDNSEGLKPSPRAAFGMCTFDSDKIFICGGRDSEGRKNDIFIFDSTKNKWIVPSPIYGKPPTERSFHTCITSNPNDRKILLFGGLNNEQVHLNDFFVFDSRNSTWYEPNFDFEIVSEKNYPSPRGFHTCQILQKYLIVFGGSNSYDPNMGESTKYLNDTWSINIESILKADQVDPSKVQQQTIDQPPSNDPTLIKQSK